MYFLSESGVVSQNSVVYTGAEKFGMELERSIWTPLKAPGRGGCSRRIFKWVLLMVAEMLAVAMAVTVEAAAMTEVTAVVTGKYVCHF